MDGLMALGKATAFTTAAALPQRRHLHFLNMKEQEFLVFINASLEFASGRHREKESEESDLTARNVRMYSSNPITLGISFVLSLVPIHNPCHSPSFPRPVTLPTIHP